jgi:hypothetical protein
MSGYESRLATLGLVLPQPMKRAWCCLFHGWRR